MLQFADSALNTLAFSKRPARRRLGVAGSKLFVSVGSEVRSELKSALTHAQSKPMDLLPL